MAIQIRQRYRPFSHIPGTEVLLPKSPVQVRLFPTHIELVNGLPQSQCGGGDRLEVDLEGVGSCSQFTAVQNLEQHDLRLFMSTSQGYYRYRLFVEEGTIYLALERSPKEGITLLFLGKKCRLQPKERVRLPITCPATFFQTSPERLGLGCHKQQDWSLIIRRNKLEELLPLWFQLGKHLPRSIYQPIGTLELLQQGGQLVADRDRERLGPFFLDLFKVAFTQMWIPNLSDRSYSGLLPRCEARSQVDLSPFPLLSEAAFLIRSFFLREDSGYLELLPALPVEIASGRFVNLITGVGVSCDLEWSKKSLRRLWIHAQVEGSLNLRFPSSLKQGRLSCGRGRGGQKREATLFRCHHDSLHLRRGESYLIDRFER